MSKIKVVCKRCNKEFESNKRNIQRKIEKMGDIYCNSCSHIISNNHKGLKKAKEDIAKYNGVLLATEWINNKTKYEFIGECGHKFEARYDNTLRLAKKRGKCLCPACGRKSINHSSIEDLVAQWLKEFNVDFVVNYRPKKFEYDLYIPSKKVAIEIHGVYWHSETMLKTKWKIPKPRTYHLEKWNEAKSLGITLLQFFDLEIKSKPGIVKDIIKAKLNLIDKKLHARKCEIVVPSQTEASKFLEENHIFGSLRGSSYIGLKHNEELVAIVTYQKIKNSILITRFCTKRDAIIRGAISKMLKQIQKSYPELEIVTYADKRFTNGEVYKRVGFKEAGHSKPSYWYFKKGSKSNILLNRRLFQKKYIAKNLHKFNIEPIKEIIENKSLTEYEIMLAHNCDRVWDTGHIKFLLKQKN